MTFFCFFSGYLFKNEHSFVESFIRFKILLHGKLREELFQIWYWNSYSDSSVLISAPFSQNDNPPSLPPPPSDYSQQLKISPIYSLVSFRLIPSVSSFHTLIVIRVPLCALTPSSGELNSYSWKLFLWSADIWMKMCMKLIGMFL